MAESLYYFIPRQPGDAGRHLTNALVTLALVAAGCAALLFAARTGIAAWMTNPDLARYLPLLAVFLACSLVSVAFEIVMVSRKKHVAAATVYAGSDVVRTACLIVPALAIGGLRGVLAGATAYAALRLAAMLVYFWREFGNGLRCDSTLWRGQLGVRAAVRPGGRRGDRAGEPAPVFRRIQIQCGDVRHLRRRLSADPARRSDLHLDRQRDDGEDGRGDRRRTRSNRAGVVARHDMPPRDDRVSSRGAAAADRPRDHRDALHGPVRRPACRSS